MAAIAFIFVLCSLLEENSLYKVDVFVYVLVLVSLLSFAIGCEVKIKSKKQENYVLNTKVYYFAYIVFLSIVSIPTINSLIILIQGKGLNYIYQLYLGAMQSGEINELGINGVIALLYTYIGLPLVYVLCVASLSMFYISRRKRFLLLAYPPVLINFLFTSGKNVILFALAATIVLFLFFYKDKKSTNVSNKKKKFANKAIKNVSVFAVSGVLLLVIIMMARKGMDSLSEALDYVFLYFAKPFVLFSERINRFENANTFGLLSTYGFTRPLLQALEKIGIEEAPIFENVESVFASIEDAVYVGENAYTNAMPTAVYYFYIDGGVLGVVLLSFLVGVFAKKFFCDAHYSPNARTLSYLLLFFAVVLFYYFFLFNVVNFRRALPFIYLLFFFRKSQSSLFSRKVIKQ